MEDGDQKESGARMEQRADRVREKTKRKRGVYVPRRTCDIAVVCLALDGHIPR